MASAKQAHKAAVVDDLVQYISRLVCMPNVPFAFRLLVSNANALCHSYKFSN